MAERDKTQKTSGKAPAIEPATKKTRKPVSKTVENPDAASVKAKSAAAKTAKKTVAKKAPKTAEKAPEIAKTAENLAEDRIRKRNNEVRRLKKIYKDLPESQKTIVSALLERVAYLNDKLKSTEELLDEEGLVVDFENGSQVITRLNPNLKAYTELIKIYSNITEQIEDMIRHDRDHARKENRGADEDDPLIAFINARK